MSAAVDRLRAAVIRRVVEGDARTPPEARRAAFDNRAVDPRARALVAMVAQHAWKVTDADVAAAKASGLSDDEIFELAVAASLGQATRQMQSALAALDAAQPRDVVKGEMR